MKFQDVISRVRTVAGDENEIIYPNALLVDWINDAMRECVTDNMLLQKTATVPTVVGTASYDLPTDILKLYSVKFNNSKLPVYTLEQFDELITTDGTERGNPTSCRVWAGKISLYPTPDSVKNLSIDYSYTPTEATVGTLATEVPLPVLYHRRIVDYCLAMVAEMDDDMSRYQMKMQEFKTGVQNLKDHPESTHDLYPFISVDSADFGDMYYDQY